MKEVLEAMPSTQAPNWEEVFYVNPLVAGDAIRAMLLQKGKGSHYIKPVYCASRVKTVAKMALSEIELVMVSVVFAWPCFCHYLF